jgi:anti-sigma factor RsiW
MNQRDLELLSSYLDGQLKPSDSARLEARLSTDPALRAVLDDLRSARGLLRKLPLRKAPRNFTLTPKMVGKNPPLPRTYPAFRFVSALATLLLFVTLGLNFLAPQMAAQSTNLGYGGGGAPDTFAAEAPAATQAPAATEAPEAAAPSVQSAPLPTATLSVEDTARNAVETPAEKNGATQEPGVLGQAPIQGAQPVPVEATRSTQPVPPIWQFVLAGVAILSALIMLGMRQMSINRWRRKQ